MSGQEIIKLEQLLSGKENSIEIAGSSNLTREVIVDQINTLFHNNFPSCWMNGEFLDCDSDYLVYDLHLLGVNAPKSFSFIRLFDFGYKFKVIRI
jgi:hypothetical protein